MQLLLPSLAWTLSVAPKQWCTPDGVSVGGTKQASAVVSVAFVARGGIHGHLLRQPSTKPTRCFLELLFRIAV